MQACVCKCAGEIADAFHILKFKDDCASVPSVTLKDQEEEFFRMYQRVMFPFEKCNIILSAFGSFCIAFVSCLLLCVYSKKKMAITN